MAKVRVPKADRPPTRFGILDRIAPECDEAPQLKKGMVFRVKGEYRYPKKGEFFWSSMQSCVDCAWVDFTLFKRVILEPVTRLVVESPDAEKRGNP